MPRREPAGILGPVLTTASRGGCRTNPVLSGPFWTIRACPRTSSPSTATNRCSCHRTWGDWRPADHLAWFVIEAIDALDLEPFYAAYRADGHGAAATSRR